ncbi:MAG TPA: DUF692 domain-containing protein [Polyangiaceae bacterium]|nr:DUF692 domain-containing protein [Polyangiaceae bacterium]
MDRLRGVGLGFRPALASDLLRQRGCVDFVEVVAEACLFNGAQRREVRALSELWPVVPHGVKLSLGSANGIDVARVRALGQLARELKSSVITEHVAFVRTLSREIGHLTPLPRTATALGVLERNLGVARAHLPDLPLLVENVAWTVRYPERGEPHFPEPEFYSELVERTGVGMLLDLGNLYANAINAGLEPESELRRYPLHAVGMLHLAGGIFEDGFYFDDHAHAVPDQVLALLETALAAVGDVPIVIERDALFPPFAELSGEVSQVRAMLRGRERLPVHSSLSARRPTHSALQHPVLQPSELQQFESQQATLAELLTNLEFPNSSELAGFEAAELWRSRAILQRKRLEEALPLLARLGAYWRDLEPWAERVIAQCPRAPRLAAVTDALQIASRAQREFDSPEIAFAARVDALVLSARFIGEPGQALRPRHPPFVAHVRSPRGARLWVIKGFGSSAQTRIVERNTAV